MPKIRVSEERAIHAPADVVYRLIADYRQHHGNFLPPAFSDLNVELGGVGAGTVITFRLHSGGQTRSFRGRIDEPEPGRVLTETYFETSMVTSFQVSPGTNDCRVRIETTWESNGLRGAIERLVAPRLLRGVYVDELARLDRYAREQSAGGPIK